MAEMKIAKIFSSSRNTKFLFNTTDTFNNEIIKVEKDFDIKTDIVLKSNNKDPLTVVYNKFINDSKDADFAIVMHSDVTFDYYSLIKHYLDVKNNYDIVGLAGTRKIDLSISPLTWFTGSKNYSDQRYGKVIHRQFNLGESFFNGKHHPTTTDIEVSTIDGLCMILGEKILKSDIKFDEQFLFDFYDLDFCLTAKLKYGFKIGVIVEPVIHESVGTSILKPEYLISEKKFRNKWELN